MEELDNITRNRIIDYNKLLEYGFVKKEEYYEYTTKIKDYEFELIIRIYFTGKLTFKVMDLMTEEEYILVNIPNATGEFVGRIRQECVKVIKDIYLNCSKIEVFKSEYTKLVIEYLKKKYNEEPEFLYYRNYRCNRKK